ncbi:MIF-like protein mif-2 [Aplysia californica]|uniref:D-dopachrome decarboxylase n=1 Tax=Aplysia californica TaxID=6500 RepID=A0ABM0JVF5_APLCA|nr:MIF-like protein mif-2 [Aplysia californica]XP_005102481.1 MIF-like protein mif-2 [Aplysia californica]XP_035826717.1 MIF-like protein mif-2 [Aplysia californica]
MPVCHLYTNLKDSDLKDGVEGRIANVVAETLGKPIERVTVIIIPGVRIQRLESTAPACTFNVSSFEVFDKERNPKYSPAIYKVLQEELDLPKERCVVLFHDLDKNMIAV